MTPAPDRSWLDLLRTQAERFAQVVEHGVAPAEVLLRTLWHRKTQNEVQSRSIELLSGALTP